MSRFWTLSLQSVLACAAALTPEQAVQVRSINGLQWSPDQKRLICVVSETPKGATPQSHLWMYDLGRDEFREFTYSEKSESAPQWSPDGRTLAFLSSRGERMQIYLMRPDGGEASALTTGKNAAGAFRWSPDSTEIAFLAAEPKSDADEKKEKDKDDAKVSDRESALNRLWVVNVATREVRQITRGDWRIEQFEWISSDQGLVAASNLPKSEVWNEAIYKVSMKDGGITAFSQPRQPFGGIVLSPDRRNFSFTGTRTGGPSPHDLFIQSVEGPLARNATASIDRVVHGAKWVDSRSIVVSVADGFRGRLYRVPLEGAPGPIDLPYSNGDFAVSSAGPIAFVGMDFDRLPELFLKDPDGRVRQISQVQESWKGLQLAGATLFHFKSFDGRDIEAALMKPAVDGDAKPPLILYVHGGPAGNFSASYQSWAQLLTSHGYAVLMVNPRGSTGYGEEFLKANRADWGGGDFKDLMAAVDAVLARGEVDPNRVAIGGWSYGGYMAEWAITQTNRFKAAVSGAGMFDLAAEFGTESNPAYDEWYFGTPWEHPESFAHSSPYMYIKNAKTPTLILQGENDTTDPVGQSTALYRALKRYGVETELVVYPREPHGPREEKHQVDLLRRMLEWFDRYLAGAPASSR